MFLKLKKMSLNTLHTLNTNSWKEVEELNECFLFHKTKSMSTLLNNTYQILGNGCSSFLSAVYSAAAASCQGSVSQITFCT